MLEASACFSKGISAFHLPIGFIIVEDCQCYPFSYSQNDKKMLK